MKQLLLFFISKKKEVSIKKEISKRSVYTDYITAVERIS